MTTMITSPFFSGHSVLILRYERTDPKEATQNDPDTVDQTGTGAMGERTNAQIYLSSTSFLSRSRPQQQQIAINIRRAFNVDIA